MLVTYNHSQNFHFVTFLPYKFFDLKSNGEIWIWERWDIQVNETTISVTKRPKSFYGHISLQKRILVPKQTCSHRRRNLRNLNLLELKSTIAKVSQGLLSQGITKNDVVLLFAPNSIRYPICFLSIVAIGAIASTANPLYTTQEQAKQVKDSDPKLVIAVSELLDKVKGFNLPGASCHFRTKLQHQPPP